MQFPTSDPVEKNINLYKLWRVLLGAKHFGESLRNSKVAVVTYNMQVLVMINSEVQTAPTWPGSENWSGSASFII